LAAALELAPDDADRFQAAVEPVRRRGSPKRELARSDRLHSLPVPLTSFVGREQELASVSQRLRTARLLTLTGVGGSGKTRLAIEVARLLADSYQDGARLVELAPITDAALVPYRVAAALDVPESASRPLAQTLADALRDSDPAAGVGQL
jgi:hypothetical protein